MRRPTLIYRRGPGQDAPEDDKATGAHTTILKAPKGWTTPRKGEWHSAKQEGLLLGGA